jgi:hypothetical protein
MVRRLGRKYRRALEADAVVSIFLALAKTWVAQIRCSFNSDTDSLILEF